MGNPVDFQRSDASLHRNSVRLKKSSLAQTFHIVGDLVSNISDQVPRHREDRDALKRERRDCLRSDASLHRKSVRLKKLSLPQTFHIVGDLVPNISEQVSRHHGNRDALKRERTDFGM